MCVCIECGKPCDCGEKYCEQCLVNESYKDNASMNLKAGGSFYGEKLDKEREDV